jgi:hypothetical protein
MSTQTALKAPISEVIKALTCTYLVELRGLEPLTL